MKNPGLEYRSLGGDLLVFKNTNDCLTIARNNISEPVVIFIESSGKQVSNWQEFTEENPFTKEEVEWYLHIYSQTEAGRR